MTRQIIAAAENGDWSFEFKDGKYQFWLDGACRESGTPEDIERYIRAHCEDLEYEADLHRDALAEFKSATEEPRKCPEF